MCSVFVILHTDEGPSSLFVYVVDDLFYNILHCGIMACHCVSQKVAGLILPYLFLPVTL